MNALAFPASAAHDAGAFESLVRDRQFHFPLGIPGFPDDHRWVLTQAPSEAPFAWLNSLDTPGLAFAVVEPRHLLDGFTFEVPDDDLDPIGSPDPRELGLLIILRVERREEIHLFANLRAPVLLNLRLRLGRQVILPEDSGYGDEAEFVL